MAAIKLVRARAEAMQLASEMAPGGMATVIYSADSKLQQAIVKAKEWCLERGINEPECRIATYLHPNMKVIAGHIEVSLTHLSLVLGLFYENVFYLGTRTTIYMIPQIREKLCSSIIVIVGIN